MLKWLGLSALIVVLDQITKLVVTRTFTLHESVEVTPFFNLVLVHNRGAAFSFLSNAGGWQRELFIAHRAGRCGVDRVAAAQAPGADAASASR